MLTEEEIVATLRPLNGTHFSIEDIPAYARKVLSRGKALWTRKDGALVSYVLYYDDEEPEVFVSMVWTDPRLQGRGLATALLERLVRETSKPIALEVNVANPARALYAELGFETTARDGTRERMTLGSRVAIMQPYFFPYIGYFHLAHAADLFVFYDDVHFIKRGRIHRNNILVNGGGFAFTVPIADASQNRLIMETRIHDLARWREGFMRQLTHAYRKAPYFDAVMDAVCGVLGTPSESIADLAIASVAGVHAYLGVPFRWTRSSAFSPETRGLEKAQRLIAITKQAGGSRYVNTIGGMELYDKARFAEHGIALSFVQVAPVEYRQFGDSFVPWLSMIDVMMFNAPERIREMRRGYALI